MISISERDHTQTFESHRSAHVLPNTDGDQERVRMSAVVGLRVDDAFVDPPQHPSGVRIVRIEFAFAIVAHCCPGFARG